MTFGVLALGHKESLGSRRSSDRYEEIDAERAALQEGA